MTVILRNLKIGSKLGLLMSAFLVFMIAFIYLINRYGYEELLNDLIMHKVSRSKQEMQGVEKRDISILSMALELSLKDPELKKRYLTGDRDKLYEYGRPYFEGLKDRYGITHFYFHRPDGTNFLMLHDKESHGGKIERVILAEAMSKKSLMSRLEMGESGFALRVAAPYYNQGELIGYMELGLDVDRFLETLKEGPNHELIFVADKKHLRMEEWVSVRKKAGLPDNWDELKNHIWGSMPAENHVAKGCFTEENIEKIEIEDVAVVIGISGEKVVEGFACGGFSLSDAAGRHIGEILSVVDVRNQISVAKKWNRYIVIAFISFSIPFFLLLYLLIRGFISGPIKELAGDVRQISEGDLTVRMRVRTGDEVGILATAINDMISRLRTAQSNLEGIVESRTVEVLEANRKLASANEELKSVNSRLEAITAELEATNMDLSRANNELSSMERLKIDFLRTISHELRSPITPTLGYLEMLRDGDAGELEPRQREFVEEMYICTKNMQMLIDELLEAASIQAGNFYLNIDEVDICHVLRESVNGIRKYADANRTEIESRIPYNPAPVEGDRRWLKDVFTHILRNAVKFNREGGKVTVTLEEVEKGVEVVISDTGIGIPTAKLEKIFESFYQSEAPSNRYYDGIGLGLYLIKRLVDAHGGSMNVISNVGAGSTFTVFIPRKHYIAEGSAGPKTA